MSLVPVRLIAAGIANPALKAQLADWTARYPLPKLLAGAAVCGLLAVIFRARGARTRWTILAGAACVFLLIASGAHFFARSFLDVSDREQQRTHQRPGAR